MFFELAGRLTRRGIQASAGMELDKHVDEILVDPRFTIILTPLPRGTKRPRSRTPKRQRAKASPSDRGGQGEG